MKEEIDVYCMENESKAADVAGKSSSPTSSQSSFHYQCICRDDSSACEGSVC